MRLNVISILLTGLSFVSADSDYTSTCGGFVRSNSVAIPFEKIKIKLLASSGNLRGETEVSSAGDYVLAVYNKGNYQVRIDAPNGWTFDPPQIEVNLEEGQDCPQNLDFTFKGFSVIGKVVSKGSTNGPAGVEVTLVEGGSKRTLKTQEGGNFIFPAVTPGTYQIQFRGETVEVRVKNENLRLADGQFVIEGYSIKGRIEWESPLKTASLVLANKQNAPCCGKRSNRDLPKGFVLPSDLKVSCVVKADPKGSFEFPCVEAIANYVAFAQVLTDDGQPMEVSPNKIEFGVSHEDTVLDSFQVTGFPVSGTIDLTSGFVEIKVLETGFKTISDKDGNYKLNGLRNGRYTLQLSKSGFLFEEKKVIVDQKIANIPAIEPDKFEVCGEVQLSEAVEVSMTNIRSKLTQKTWSEVASRRFCHFLEKGDYVFKPNHAIRLSPFETTVSVPMSKNKRIVFSQFLAAVQGRVECLDKQCSGVRISLKGEDTETKTTNNLGEFKFDKVDPGTYEICVSHETNCYEQGCKSITVIDSDIDKISFRQIGQNMKVHSTHITDIEIGGKILRIKAGLSSICVTETKPLLVKPIGCHKFEKENELLYDPSKNEKLILKATAHRLRVRVESQDQVKDLKVAVISNGEKEMIEMKNSKLQDKLHVYTAELFYPKDSEVSVEAFSDSLIFKPAQVNILMPDDCVGANIFGKTGIQVEGSIKPAIDQVQIIVSAAKGDPTKALTVMTGPDGKYKVGPLDSHDFHLEASKEGYGFERIGSTNDFTAVKYSRIDIVAVQEDNNAPLSNALVVITGVNGTVYRNSTKTGDNGDLSLIRLTPGSYNVRVMMKEYSFEPKAKEVKISENSEERLVIKGKKIFFSILGKTTSISGEIETNVWVEAMSEGCDKHEEDALSDEKGNFRIRGLKENCIYDVRLKKDEKNVLFGRTLPATRKVQVQKQDINMDLLVVRSLRTTQLSVALRVDGVAMDGLVLHLISGDNQVVGSVPASDFFYFPNDLPLDGKTYHVEFQLHNAELPSHMQLTLFGTNDTSVSFAANKAYHHLELQLAIVKTVGGGEGQEMPSSPFALVFPVFIALAILYRSEIGGYFRQRQDGSTSGDKKKNSRR